MTSLPPSQGFLCFALVFLVLVQVAFWRLRNPTQVRALSPFCSRSGKGWGAWKVAPTQVVSLVHPPHLLPGCKGLGWAVQRPEGLGAGKGPLPGLEAAAPWGGRRGPGLMPPLKPTLLEDTSGGMGKGIRQRGREGPPTWFKGLTEEVEGSRKA